MYGLLRSHVQCMIIAGCALIYDNYFIGFKCASKFQKYIAVCIYIYIIYLCKKRLGSIALFSLRPTSTNQGDDSSTASPRVCVVPSPVNPYPMGTVASAQAAVDEMYGDMAEFVSMSSQMTSSCKRAKTANQARNTMQCHHHIKVW